MKATVRHSFLSLVIIIVILMMPFVACAPRAEVATINIPGSTISKSVTPTASPNPTPTVVPSPAMDEYGFTEERKTELDQQFQDFLNKQGEFTPEKMSAIMMETLSGLDKSEVGLGIISDRPDIEGYVFDYLEKDNRIFLFVGFDGKDSKRFITPLEIPSYFYEIYKPAHFGVVKYSENNIGTGVENREGKDYSDNKQELILLLDSFKGRIVVFGLDTVKINESAGDDLNSTIRAEVISYINELNSKVVLAFGLFQLLPQDKALVYIDQGREKGDSDAIIKITNSGEMGHINIEQVPLISVISYFYDEFQDAG